MKQVAANVLQYLGGCALIVAASTISLTVGLFVLGVFLVAVGVLVERD